MRPQTRAPLPVFVFYDATEPAHPRNGSFVELLDVGLGFSDLPTIRFADRFEMEVPVNHLSYPDNAPLQRTWAVINRKTRKAAAMCRSRESAIPIAAQIKRDVPGFKFEIREVRIPADHSVTGSFWEKKF